MSDDGAVVRRLYSAWNDRRLDAVADFLDEQVVWREAAQVPGASVHRGRDAALQCLRGLTDTIGEFRVELDELRPAANGRWLATFHMVGQGPLSEFPYKAWNAHLLSLGGGRIVEVGHFVDRDEAEAAARE